jgi:hypothetical protein
LLITQRIIQKSLKIKEAFQLHFKDSKENSVISFALASLLSFQISSAQSLTPSEILQHTMCMTNGQVQQDSQHKYAITSATARGVVTASTTQNAKIIFSYLGPIISTSENENGHMQIGIKLHAMNSCNVLYAMWPVVGGPIKVSLKRNDGMIFHSECKTVKNQGYTLLTPLFSTTVPSLTVGVQHTLQADYDNSNLNVYADGGLVWSGRLSRSEMPFFGPVGFRSDGGSFNFKFFSNADPSQTPIYNLSSFGTYSCLPAKPSIKYPANLYVLTKNESLQPILASSQAGFIRSCSIQPALQSGLLLNSRTCEITGKPTMNQSSTTYSVTASNEIGSFTTPLSIRVMTPPGVQFTSSHYIFKRSSPVLITPIYSGNAVESCQVSPALPPGLSLSQKCQISGVPLAQSNLTQYQVTAKNLVGSARAVLNLGIKDPPMLVYSSTQFNFKLGDRVSLTLRSNGGLGSPPNSCTIDRDLPAGISFNSTTCTISGYANSLHNLTTYKVTGTNEVGSHTVQLSIVITK